MPQAHICHQASADYRKFFAKVVKVHHNHGVWQQDFEKSPQTILRQQTICLTTLQNIPQALVSPLPSQPEYLRAVCYFLQAPQKYLQALQKIEKALQIFAFRTHQPASAFCGLLPPFYLVYFTFCKKKHAS